MRLHLNSISRQRIAKILGWTLLAIILYAMASAFVLLASLVMFQKDIIPDLPWVSSVQKQLYKGARNIWQARPDCAVFDPDVIYKPKNGKCQFDNVEFKTELNFSPEGRYTGDKPAGKGIAVLGDSHAMGWGVGDKETFSAELQRLSGRPVFNLAVSSYGTVRELIRMEKSGLLDKVDTVIIQYCDNDIDENIEFRPLTLQMAQQKFSVVSQSGTTAPSLSSKLDYLRKAYGAAFRAPFSNLKSQLIPKKDKPKDFFPHYQPIVDAVKQHEALKTKRVIVFYSNAHGQKFKGFPLGKDRQLPNVEFVDLGLVRDDYYRIDDHLTSAGHMQAAQQLLKYVQPQ